MNRRFAGFFLFILLACIRLGVGPAWATEAEPPLLTVGVSGKTLDRTYEDLLLAIGRHGYAFVRHQAIDSRLVPQQWETKAVRIVYFCDFGKMDRSLSLDVRAAQFLPCRITLLEHGNGVDLMAINPAWVSQSLGNPLLHPMCLELKRDYLAIMEEAAL